MRKLILMCLGLVIAVGFAFGCGSDDESTGAEAESSAPLTKAQFIQQADAICAKTKNERVADGVKLEKERAAQGKDPEGDFDTAVRMVIAPSLRHQAEELEALEPPAEDKAELDRMIGNLSKVSEVLEKEGVKGVPRSGYEQFEREAAAYGFRVCGLF